MEKKENDDSTERSADMASEENVDDGIVTEDAPTTEPPSAFDASEEVAETDVETPPSDDEGDGGSMDEQPQHASDRIKVVAIPFINDGASNVQLFYESMFRAEDGKDAIHVAEKYFFERFDDDEPPKWDGVLVCQYNFTKSEIVKDDRNGIIRLRDFKANWLWKASDARNNVTFNVKCTMPKVWASHFQSFLREMERYGRLGHSGQISFMADGDGNFRPKFRFTKEFETVQGIESSRISSKAETMFDAG